MSSSTALAKRPADADRALMPPPVAKRIKRPKNILEEDDFQWALEYIIARDFFPDSAVLEAAEELRRAREAGDQEWEDSASTRLEEAVTPAHRRRRPAQPLRSNLSQQTTPAHYAGSTPSQTPRTPRMTPPSTNPSKPRINTSLSLNDFLATYTTSDHESFNQSLDRQNAATLAKHAWAHTGNRHASKRELAQQRVLASGASEERLALIRTAETRPAGVTFQNLPTNPQNSLMFAPDSLQDAHPHLQSRADAAAARSLAPPKAIRHANTNFRSAAGEDQDGDADADDSRSVGSSTINAALSARLRGRTPSVAPSEAPSDTPRVGGYAYVDEEPTAGEMAAMRAGKGDAAAGVRKQEEAEERRRQMEEEQEVRKARRQRDDELLAAVLERYSVPNPFAIQARSKREELHDRLVDRTAARKKELAARQYAATPVSAAGTPRSRSRAALTPAGRSLLDRIGTPRRAGELFGVSPLATPRRR